MNRTSFHISGERTLMGLPVSPANEFLWAIGEEAERVSSQVIHVAVSGAYDGAVYRALRAACPGRELTVFVDIDKQLAVPAGSKWLAQLGCKVLHISTCQAPDIWIVDCTVYGEDPVAAVGDAIRAGASVIFVHDSKTVSTLRLPRLAKAREAAGVLLNSRLFDVTTLSVKETTSALKRGMTVARRIKAVARPADPAPPVTPRPADPAPPAAPHQKIPTFAPPVTLPTFAPPVKLPPAVTAGGDETQVVAAEAAVDPPPCNPESPAEGSGDTGVEIKAEDTNGDGEADQVVIRPKTRGRGKRVKNTDDDGSQG